MHNIANSPKACACE